MTARDIEGDPGLLPTTARNERGPYVGRARGRRLRRFAHHARLDRVLLELQAGFGPQRWWPASTPFEVIIGAVLTQNTAWINVQRALEKLAATTPLTPGRLLELPEDRLAEAIRPSGYFRTKARKLRSVASWYLERGGLEHLARAPLRPLRTDLLGVHGVGPETADSILCYAAGRRSAIVDVYTRRLVGRHGLADPDLPYEELRAWLERHLVRSQVVYEEFHALVVRAGAGFCRPQPRCDECPATTPRRLLH